MKILVVSNIINNFADVNKNIHQALRITVKRNDMKKSEYREKSATAEGRKNLHSELLAEIKNRMDGFVNNAPEANRAKVSALFSAAMKKLEEHGNSILFDFFASDDINDRDFIKHTQEVINDKY